MKTVGMFLGAETVNWSLSQFTDATKLAKSLGCTEMAVKVADGSIRWYDSQGGWGSVRQACLNGGLDMLPYMYSYGNKFGALAQEIETAKALMALRPDHAAMLDMEVEWNGQTGWAATLCAALEPVKGILTISTWANPAQQDWLGVIAALRPCVNIWGPQEYDTFLVGCESQFPAGLHIQPAINLPESWPGPNDPVAATRTAMARGHDGVWLWEYTLAVSNPSVVKEIAAVVNPPQEGPMSIILEHDAQGTITGAHDATNTSEHVGGGMATELQRAGLLATGSITHGEYYADSTHSVATIHAGDTTQNRVLTYAEGSTVKDFADNDLASVVGTLLTQATTPPPPPPAPSVAFGAPAASEANGVLQLSVPYTLKA